MLCSSLSGSRLRPGARRFHILLACACLCAPLSARAERLTLDDCIARTLANHPDLRAAAFEREAVRARGRQASALAPPSVALEAGKLGTPLSADEHEGSARLTQELGAPGARAARRRQSHAADALAEAGEASVALRLRGEVTRAYRRLQASSLEVRTLESLRRTASDLEHMVEARLRTGGARYLDVLRARSERARIENDLWQARRGLRHEERALNAFMAQPASAAIEAADSMRFMPLTDSLEHFLRAAAERPRLRAARAALARGDAGVGLARASARPALSWSAGLERVPGAAVPGWGAGIEFTLPFLPWTASGAQAAEARAEQSGARAQLETAERDVEALVRDAYESARTAEAQVRQFDRVLLADAADAIRTATQNFQAGQIDGLELLETLRTLRSIELEHLRALLDYELALTDLAVAE